MEQRRAEGRAAELGQAGEALNAKARGSAMVLQQYGVPGALGPRKDSLGAVLQWLKLSG